MSLTYKKIEASRSIGLRGDSGTVYPPSKRREKHTHKKNTVKLSEFKKHFWFNYKSKTKSTIAHIIISNNDVKSCQKICHELMHDIIPHELGH